MYGGFSPVIPLPTNSPHRQHYIRRRHHPNSLPRFKSKLLRPCHTKSHQPHQNFRKNNGKLKTNTNKFQIIPTNRNNNPRTHNNNSISYTRIGKVLGLELTSSDYGAQAKTKQRLSSVSRKQKYKSENFFIIFPILYSTLPIIHKRLIKSDGGGSACP